MKVQMGHPCTWNTFLFFILSVCFADVKLMFWFSCITDRDRVNWYYFKIYYVLFLLILINVYLVKLNKKVKNLPFFILYICYKT